MGDDRKTESVENASEVDSITRSAEEIGANEQEAGRTDTGEESPTGRPTGTSSARDFTSVDPKEPIDGGSPAG